MSKQFLKRVGETFQKFNIKVIKMYFPLYKMLIIMWENACYNLVNKIDTQRRGTTYPNKRNLTLPKVVGSVAVL